MYYVSGFYAPVTSEGNIIVDDVLVSCYASVENHDLANLAMTPIRRFSKIVEWILGDGIEFSVLAKSFGIYLMSSIFLTVLILL